MSEKSIQQLTNDFIKSTREMIRAVREYSGTAREISKLNVLDDSYATNYLSYEFSRKRRESLNRSYTKYVNEIDNFIINSYERRIQAQEDREERREERSG